MKESKQKLIIENLLSSTDIFSRCIGILKSEYFDPEYKVAVKFLTDYYEKYNNMPDFRIMNAEFDLGFTVQKITTDQIKYTCDSIEQFAKESAIYIAIKETMDDMDTGKTSGIIDRFDKAMSISLEKDLGSDVYDDPEAYLKRMTETQIYYSTGIKALDKYLDGGMARKQFTLFSANSGVGKSNMLANLGANFSANENKLNVLYIALELTEDMIRLRISTILSNIKMMLWKQKIPEISGKLLNIHNSGAGTYIVKRIAGGANANDIKNHIKQYELKHGFAPDVLIIDYLDLMTPNGGTKNKSVSEQDKEKSEEVSELGHLYNMILLSASQQNREALRLASPDQGVIAGGITKVNTVDNYISLFMDDNMRLRGEMMGYILKARSSKGTGKVLLFKFDEDTLRITDSNPNGDAIVIDKMKGNKTEIINRRLATIKTSIEGMPTTKPVVEEITEKEKFISSINEDMGGIPIDLSINDDDSNIIDNDQNILNPLLGLMSTFGDMKK